MTFDQIDELIAKSKNDHVSDQLKARSIASNSRVDPYYAFLRRLMIDTRPKGVFLEIGCYYGVAAAYMADAKGYTENLYLGVDINPIPFSDPGVIFIQGDSTSMDVYARVKAVAEAHGGIFAVFQDSSHHFKASVKEWVHYSPLVRPGGIWMCDDITPAFKRPDEPKGMVEYFDDLPGEKRLYDDLHIGSRIGMVLL